MRHKMSNCLACTHVGLELLEFLKGGHDVLVHCAHVCASRFQYVQNVEQRFDEMQIRRRDLFLQPFNDFAERLNSRMLRAG